VDVELADFDVVVVEVEKVVGIEAVELALLELDTTTGLRLLYIDNRDEPPHY
jgi:hypothetical protein